MSSGCTYFGHAFYWNSPNTGDNNLVATLMVLVLLMIQHFSISA